LADWFQKRRLLNNFPIGSYVKTMSADGGHFKNPTKRVGLVQNGLHHLIEN
jgi:hypothetical protein